MENDERAVMISVLLIFLIIIAVILVFLVLFIVFDEAGGFISGNSVDDSRTCRYVQVPYEEVEHYISKVPYYSEETYYEKKYYQDYDCDSRRLKYRSKIIDCDVEGDEVYVEVDVKNRDSKSGDFEIEFGIECDDNGCEDSEEEELYIRHGSTKTVSGIFDIGSGDFEKCFIDVTPEKKRVCEYDSYSKSIPKTKTFTKFKEVAKTRTVVKYRSERKCD
jgi:hypothetical protein